MILSPQFRHSYLQKIIVPADGNCMFSALAIGYLTSVASVRGINPRVMYNAKLFPALYQDLANLFRHVAAAAIAANQQAKNISTLNDEWIFEHIIQPICENENTSKAPLQIIAKWLHLVKNNVEFNEDPNAPYMQDSGQDSWINVLNIQENDNSMKLKTPVQYYSYMTTARRWGSWLEYAQLIQILNRPVVLIRQFSHKMDVTFNNPNDEGKPVVYLADVIFIQHTGNHFDCYIPKQGYEKMALSSFD